MYFDAKGTRFRITFEHTPYEDRGGKRTRMKSICKIIPQIDGKDAPDFEGAVFGYSICSNKDQFIKERGRLISLGRALKITFNNDEIERGKIAYFNRRIVHEKASEVV